MSCQLPLYLRRARACYAGPSHRDRRCQSSFLPVFLLPVFRRVQDRIAPRPRQAGAASVEPAEKHTCCGSNAGIVQVDRQMEVALFQRPAAGPLEKPYFTGEERSVDRHVVTLVVDGRVNSCH